MTFPVWEFSLEPSDTLTYTAFQEKMERVCRILGPGSDFEKDTYEQGYSVPATYEEAWKPTMIFYTKTGSQEATQGSLEIIWGLLLESYLYFWQ